MTDENHHDRRGFLSITVAVALAGCSEAVPTDTLPTAGPTPTPTPTVELFDAEPETLVLTADELPSRPRWRQSPPRSEGDGYGLVFEAFVDGELSYQVSLGITRRQLIDGATFDHDRLVEYYREERDATVRELPYGDVASLVTFGDEAHAIVAYRNLSVNVGLYDDGPVDQLRTVTELQVEKLQRLAP